MNGWLRIVLWGRRMPTSLSVQLRQKVAFADVLQHASVVLRRMLCVESVPRLSYGRPPASKADEQGSQDVWLDFRGACITLAGDNDSSVDMVVTVMDPRHPSYETYADCSISRTPRSNVLAAALTISLAQLVDGTIFDGAHHWIDRDEATAEHLLGALQLHEPQNDFQTAIEAVYRRQAIHKGYPAQWSF